MSVATGLPLYEGTVGYIFKTSKLCGCWYPRDAGSYMRENWKDLASDDCAITCCGHGEQCCSKCCWRTDENSYSCTPYDYVTDDYIKNFKKSWPSYASPQGNYYNGPAISLPDSNDKNYTLVYNNCIYFQYLTISDPDNYGNSDNSTFNEFVSNISMDEVEAICVWDTSGNTNLESLFPKASCDDIQTVWNTFTDNGLSAPPVVSVNIALLQQNTTLGTNNNPFVNVTNEYKNQC